MKNKEKYNLAHLHIVEHTGTTRLDGYITYVEIEYNGKIVKEYACTNEAGIKKFLSWLEEEYVPDILTDKEKDYLSAIIKPWKNKIKFIEKFEDTYDKERILIWIIGDCRNIYLPQFEKGKMYKGMELDKNYTLEDLGL